jgi:winged helix DNA-binding protein
MTSLDIARLRLHNQHISCAASEKPSDAVKRLGAIQAQDYLGALWAVGLRTKDATEKVVERAIADRAIVRTWPMRRTLHFVAAADVRWMLELLTPRIVESNARRLHILMGLDESVFTRSKKLFAKALEGGKQLKRAAMYDLLERSKISTAEGRGLHILSRLAQDGFICFGAREGKQHTFALLDEWAPEAKSKARDESLAELAGRYFTSHGPARLQDFAWWSGLRMAEARDGLEMAKSQLVRETIDGQDYWLAARAPAAKAASPRAYLLPAFDEYTVAYKDRSAALDPMYARQVFSVNGIFSPIIVVDGKIVGVWKRKLRKGNLKKDRLKKDALAIAPSPFAKLDQAETRAFAAAANRFGKFLDASVVLS